MPPVHNLVYSSNTLIRVIIYKICHRGAQEEGLGPCQGPNELQNRKGCKADPLLESQGRG